MSRKRQQGLRFALDDVELGPPRTRQPHQQQQHQQQQQQQQHQRGRRKSHDQQERRGRGRRRQEEDSIPFSREAFVKANFVFALRPGTKARGVRGRDDLEWDDVESVLVRSESPVLCPVCLDAVRVPRMTACGHIYCMVCLLRLFAYSEEVWERCPLCFAFIRESDMRCVADISVHKRTEVGDKIDLALLKRRHLGVVPVPCEAVPDDFASPALPAVGSERATFSRLCVDTPEHAREIFAREYEELEFQHAEAVSYKDALGADLARRAAADLRKAQARWSGDVIGDRAAPSTPALAVPIPGAQPVSCAGMEDSARAQLEGGEDVFFFQASDARLVFLSSFNAKCLQHQYGPDWANFPARIESAPIVAVDNVVLTPSVVKRSAFLAHVPIHANVFFVELDLRDMLSADTLAFFESEMKEREKRREAKVKADRRHERIAKANLKRAARSGMYVGYNIDYREYAERQRLEREEIERQLEHAFDASLTGAVLTEEEEAALAAALENANSRTVWGSTPAAVGSFATIVNKNDHFPALSSSPPADTAPEPLASPPLGPSAPGAWGVASSPPACPPAPPSMASPPPQPKGSGKGKGKGKGKAKRLVSTTARRSR